MRISWVLWLIATIFWLLCFVGFTGGAILGNVQTIGEVFGLVFVSIGLFAMPIICQTVWLVINLVIGHYTKRT